MKTQPIFICTKVSVIIRDGSFSIQSCLALVVGGPAGAMSLAGLRKSEPLNERERQGTWTSTGRNEL
jgi:hypothetical protein